MSEYYIGVMSGTSLDGVDIALCEIDALECKLLHYKEFAYDAALKEKVLNTIDSPLTLQEFGVLNTKLGIFFAQKIQQFLELFSLRKDQVNAIGLHGQTLWHSPDMPHPFSLQLGNANIIVAQTDIPTVSDFRSMDMANGGQGAPFAPVFHQFYYKNTQLRRAILNIGGMANITLLKDPLLGWDSGCGNVLLDIHMQETQNKSYDKDGEFAKSGQLSKELLSSLLSDEYFHKIPPKSTGREHFNASWLSKHLTKFPELSGADKQRTLTELTAQSVADALKAFKIEEIIVCGGGAKNSFLLQRLHKLTQAKITKEANSDALEAMAFAWLAYKRVHKERVALNSVTGASKNSILGALYE
jgi:anhydro-N-acetylmuramic acid kinase